MYPSPESWAAGDREVVCAVYDMSGEDQSGKIIGRHRSTGIARPRFWDRARYFGEEHRLAEALAASEMHEDRNQDFGARFA